MSFGIYLVGYIILIAGVAWGMVTAGISQKWVMIVAVIMIGIGILSGVSKTRMKDPPST